MMHHTALTQVEADCLADLIWFVKGYLAAEDRDERFFCEDHIEALRKARVNALIELEEEEQKC